MIIVLEGPDLAGKTTLARALCNAHNGPYFILKASAPDPPDRDPLEEYEEALGRLPRGENCLVVLDRWCLGEEVYGPLFRGGSRFSPGGILHAEMTLSALGALKFLMLPPVEVLTARHQQRGDDDVSVDDLPHLHELFEVTGSRYGYELLTDVIDDLGLTARVILARAGLRHDLATEIAGGAPGYVGTLQPSLVLAGDVRSGSEREDTAPSWRPAFGPPSAGCARYLMDALAPHAEIVSWEAGILNTGEHGMSLVEADYLLGRPSWIAMGRKAEYRLSQAGIRCEYIPHPQWARRFEHKKQAEYGSRPLQLGGFL